MPFLKIGDVDVLSLSGAPEHIGAEHGRLLKDKVRLMIDTYVLRSKEIFGVPSEYFIREARRCLPFVPKEYVTEMEALSAAADVPFEDLLALNCISDIDGCYMESILQCCNFVLAPPATVEGLFVHGRNLDFPPGGDTVARTATIIARQPSAGTVPTLSIGVAGFVGFFTGCNALRLTAAEVGVPARDSALEGVPISMLLRQTLERAESAEAAAAFIASSHRTSGYNLAFSDGKTKRALAIEITHSLCETRVMKNGVLVIDDVCLCKKTGYLRLVYPAGAFRFARMMQLIAARHGAITPNVCLDFLRDKYDISKAAVGGNNYNTICNAHTIHSVLFMPAEDALLVAIGHIPAPDGQYRMLDLRQIWRQPRPANDTQNKPEIRWPARSQSA